MSHTDKIRTRYLNSKTPASNEQWKPAAAGVGLCQKEVKDLSVKLNQVLGAVTKLTKQTSVPVYSGDRLALCVGEVDKKEKN